MPVTVGIRGSRNVEIIGECRGARRCCRRPAPISPRARGFARTRAGKPAAPPTPDRRADAADRSQRRRPVARARSAAVVASADPDTAVISSAISAHIDSVVNDARRNVNKFALPLMRSVNAMAANLILDIAWTHVTARVRQTLVGMAGVAMGVGFTIMMAGLMQGSQIDFLRQLVDTMPHVTVQDERRAAPPQPADREYGAVQMSNVANVSSRPGIKYPETAMASLRSWLPGDVAPSVKTTAIIDHGGGRIGVTLVGIDPRQEVRVSKLATQMREGQITDLSRAPNAIIIGQALAEKLALKTGNTVSLIGGQGTEVSATVVGIFRSGLKRVDEGQIYALIETAQMMMGQSGVINELRLRLNDPLIARAGRQSRSRRRPATSRCRGRRPIPTCCRASRCAISSC